MSSSTYVTYFKLCYTFPKHDMPPSCAPTHEELVLWSLA